jgi:hypothetical protein
VRTDNLGSTFVIEKLRSPNTALNKIAAELALDLAAKTYMPVRITHIPGVTNVLPDLLSRIFAPSNPNPGSSKLPASLMHAKLVTPRFEGFWRSDISNMKSSK